LQSGLFSLSDFNPLHRQDAPAYVKSSLNYTANLAQQASGPEFEKGSKTHFEAYQWQPGYTFVVKVPAQPTTPQSTNTTTKEVSTHAAYDLIVGCFSNLQNAQNLQLKLKRDGFAARLIQNGPLTKVSAGAAQNLSELQQLQQQAAARGLQGWVLNN